jgi:hypothetical protein
MAFDPDEGIFVRFVECVGRFRSGKRVGVLKPTGYARKGAEGLKCGVPGWLRSN